MSRSVDTRRLVKEFEADLASNLDRIERSLRSRKFHFQASHGVLIQKRGKTGKRPLVVSPIPNRIVQRALLDVVQAIPEIHAELHAGFNFGGVEGKGFGVPYAVLRAQQANRVNGFWIRTDIKSFFVNVPRPAALEKIFRHIDDSEFGELFAKATATELDNLAQLSLKDRRLFPLYEEGVAQGCCLSPLLCNLYLAEFDRMMNSRGIVCIRYIDDFILFAKDRQRAIKAFASARKYLNGLGLDVYDPIADESSDDKFSKGSSEEPIEFLGCTIRKHSIIPSRKNRDELISKVQALFDESISATANPENAIRTGKSYGAAIQNASNTVRAWGNTFGFCDDDRVMNQLDARLSDLFGRFNEGYRKRLRGMSDLDRRRLLGFFSLYDCVKKEVEFAA